MDQLHAMKVFVTIADTGNMAAAARTLGLAPASVTGTIHRLEKHFGIRLLERSTRTLALTEAGRIWLGHARSVLEQAEQAEDALRAMAGPPSGTLRISLTAGVARHFLYPAIGAFAARYPGITLSLQIEDRMADLVSEGIDVALRTGTPTDSSLVALPLLRYPHLTCASPAYLARHGTPDTPADLAGHALLTYGKTGHWRYWQDRQLLDLRLPGRHHASDSAALLALAIAGQGILRQPAWLVADSLASGALVDVLAAYVLPPRYQSGLHAVLPRRDYKPARVAAFLSFFSEQIARS